MLSFRVGVFPGDAWGWAGTTPKGLLIACNEDGIYPESDGQPGKDFQQGPMSGSTQGTEGKRAGEGNPEACMPGWRLLR